MPFVALRIEQPFRPYTYIHTHTCEDSGFIDGVEGHVRICIRGGVYIYIGE